MKTAYLLVPFAPLLGAVIAGLFGRHLGRTLTHWIAILGVLVSLVASLVVLQDVLAGNVFNGDGPGRHAVIVGTPLRTAVLGAEPWTEEMRREIETIFFSPGVSTAMQPDTTGRTPQKSVTVTRVP